jgi:flagellar FliL protein
MSAATAEATDGAGDTAPPAKGGRRKLLLISAPVLLLVVIAAGLWFSGILPPLLGMGHSGGGEEKNAEARHGEGKAGEHKAGEHKGGEGKGGEAANGPIFVEVPEIVANLNTGARKAMYVKVQIRIELVKAQDEAVVKATMPRLLDLFQTYLREMHPEELRGSAGSYRLREELTARANIALAPVRVQDVLFVELLIQ